ncbi:hypothetical protein ABT174_03825 [Streptomyces sparsogenes]|uniref:hypothetical protein n=1 Tax=Streptomyces sparsogenes TaxID=67365 RepID=UPI0033343CD4
MDAEMQTSARADNGPRFTTGELRPVDGGAGALVHSRADPRLAVEHWLLSALPQSSRRRAIEDWERYKLAVLPLGTLFSAVRLPGRLVLALSGGTMLSGEADQFLSEALGGGPVICDPRGHRYYALVPAGMPRTWHQAAEEWRTQEVDCLGRCAYLGVPRADVEQPDVAAASYWSVPMAPAARLCAPLTVARLIAAGCHELNKWADADSKDDR